MKAMQIASVVANMGLAATLFASGNLNADGGDSGAKTKRMPIL